MAGCGCGCGGNTKTRLIYACSGAANTGLLSDQVVRTLAKAGAGKMTCLAAVGAGLDGFLESARAAGENLVLDGCPVACGKKVFDQAGLPFRHVLMTDYGVEKGRTVITPEVIAEVAGRVAREVQGERDTAGTASCCG